MPLEVLWGLGELLQHNLGFQGLDILVFSGLAKVEAGMYNL